MTSVAGQSQTRRNARCADDVFALAVDPCTNSKANVAAKNNAKAALKANARMLARLINATPSVTDDQRGRVGLTIPDKHLTPARVPTEAPRVSVRETLGARCVCACTTGVRRRAGASRLALRARWCCITSQQSTARPIRPLRTHNGVTAALRCGRRSRSRCRPARLKDRACGSPHAGSIGEAKQGRQVPPPSPASAPAQAASQTHCAWQHTPHPRPPRTPRKSGLPRRLRRGKERDKEMGRRGELDMVTR